MKSKKILSVLLAIVMIASVMSICVQAAPIIYTDSVSYEIKPKATIDPTTFQASLNIDYSKISVLDGGSEDINAAVSGHIISVVATYEDIEGTIHSADYISDSNKFFALFDKVKADVATIADYNSKVEESSEKLPDANSIYLTVETEVRVDDPLAFGVLQYTIDVVGFSEPLTLGIGPVDDLLTGVAVPVEISFPGIVSDFPAVASKSVKTKPNKTEYTDAEKFDPTGIVLEIATTNGETGTFTYSEATAHMFECTPTNSENLTCYDQEVIIDFNGEQICRTPISVDHQWTNHNVSITTDKYYANKPGYHAIVCEGCGEAKDAQPHWVEDEEAWTSNGDQGFLSNGTESNVCGGCGTTLVRDAHGSADYNDALADYHFIRVILDYINMLLNIINGTMR